jgi:hypothetical protein
MFDDFDGVCRRSWNSAGKVAIKTPLCGRSIKSTKILGTPIFQDDERSQKEGAGWATMGPDHAQARAPCWPRLGVVWPPWSTSDAALSRISSSREPKIRRSHTEVFRRRYEAENTRERKALRQTGSAGGNSLPEGENDAIVTAITLDSIRIIITTISTIISSLILNHMMSRE